MHNYCPPLSPTTRALHFFQCVIIAPLFLFGEFPYNYVHQLNKKNPLKSHLSGFGANKPNPPPQKKRTQQKSSSSSSAPGTCKKKNTVHFLHLYLHGNQQRIRLTTGKFRHALTPEFHQARRLGGGWAFGTAKTTKKTWGKKKFVEIHDKW